MGTDNNLLDLEEMDKVAGGKVSQVGGFIVGFSSNDRCPKCGSGNVTAEDHGDDVDSYQCHCNDCGFDFTVTI